MLGGSLACVEEAWGSFASLLPPGLIFFFDTLSEDEMSAGREGLDASPAFPGWSSQHV